MDARRSGRQGAVMSRPRVPSWMLIRRSGSPAPGSSGSGTTCEALLAGFVEADPCRAASGERVPRHDRRRALGVQQRSAAKSMHNTLLAAVPLALRGHHRPLRAVPAQLPSLDLTRPPPPPPPPRSDHAVNAEVTAGEAVMTLQARQRRWQLHRRGWCGPAAAQVARPYTA